MIYNRHSALVFVKEMGLLSDTVLKDKKYSKTIKNITGFMLDCMEGTALNKPLNLKTREQAALALCATNLKQMDEINTLFEGIQHNSFLRSVAEDLKEGKTDFTKNEEPNGSFLPRDCQVDAIRLADLGAVCLHKDEKDEMEELSANDVALILVMCNDKKELKAIQDTPAYKNQKEAIISRLEMCAANIIENPDIKPEFSKIEQLQKETAPKGTVILG